LRYLKHTIDLKLNLYAGHELVAYVHADWDGDRSDRKSTSGYLCRLGRSLISWSSKKQCSLALISAAYASQEVVWRRQLHDDLGISAAQPTVLYEDNQGCIKLATNESMNAGTKYINVRHHHLRDLVNNNVIKMMYCQTEPTSADAFTKPLPRPRF